MELIVYLTAVEVELFKNFEKVRAASNPNGVTSIKYKVKIDLREISVVSVGNELEIQRYSGSPSTGPK